MVSRDRGQQEIVGFVLIVVLVVVGLMVFLVISMRGGDDALESVKVSNILDIVMRTTSECAIVYEPDYDTFEDLFKSCYGGKICSNLGREACDYLNESLAGVVDGMMMTESGVVGWGVDFVERDEDMVSYMAGNNMYLYNHTESFRLPSSAALKNGSLIIENGEQMTWFVRCRDKNGNENEAEYAVNFCVDPTPDATAPIIEATSVMNDGCVAEGVDTAEVRFYTNEPAQCRWSTVDQSYENMMNEMDCSGATYQSNTALLFTCISELGGIPRDGAEFYVRCADRADDVNIMRQSYVFSLRGSTALVLKNLRPNGTISGAIDPMPIELYAETLFGCNNGQAVCFWSDDAVDYIEFFDTNTVDGINTQRLDLSGGDHIYHIRCIDAGGNLVESNVTFTLDIDTNPPIVARIYEEDEMLKIVTTRESDCAYSFDNCDFVFDEGIEMPYGNSLVHVAEWNEDKTYHIKCRDEFVSEGAGCNAVIRPTENFL